LQSRLRRLPIKEQWKEMMICSRRMWGDKINGIKAMYLSVIRNLDRGIISRIATGRLIETLVERVFFQDAQEREARII